MLQQTIVVEGFKATPSDSTNIREDWPELALDQRAFGPRRVLVAFAESDGTLRGLAYADRSDPPELALECCVDHLGKGAAAAIAFCDEPVKMGPPPADVPQRFAAAQAVCARYGVHLVDWVMCDDQLFRSMKLCVAGAAEWWDVPE